MQPVLPPLARGLPAAALGAVASAMTPVPDDRARLVDVLELRDQARLTPG